MFSHDSYTVLTGLGLSCHAKARRRRVSEIGALSLRRYSPSGQVPAPYMAPRDSYGWELTPAQVSVRERETDHRACVSDRRWRLGSA